MKKKIFLRSLIVLICIFLLFNNGVYALNLSEVEYEMTEPKIVSDTLTEYAPWFYNFHLLNEGRKALGKRGGMAAQRIICYDVSPIDDTYHVGGVDTNGMISSVDGGKNWRFSISGVEYRLCHDVEFDPFNKGVAYAILGETSSVEKAKKYKYLTGLFKSYDNGLTWEHVYEAIDRNGFDITDGTIKFDGNGNLYAFFSEGVVKSTDGGKTFENLGCSLGGADAGYTEGLWVSKDGKTILTASTNKGVMGTKDGGKTWRSYGPFVDNNIIYAKGFAIDPDDDKHWYVTDGKSYHGQLFETKDGGETWENLGMVFAGWKSDFSGIAFGAKNKNGIRRMFISGRSVARGSRYSDDGGRTWEEVIFNVVDPYAKSSYTSGVFDTHPHNDSTIYFASDGGVNVSYDNGDTWYESTGGYSGHVVRNFTYDKNGYLYGAMHDFAYFNSNQPFKADENGDYPVTVTMHDVLNGEGIDFLRWNGAQTSGDVDVDPKNPDRILAATGKYGDMIISESLDGGNTWELVLDTVPVNRDKIAEVNFHDDKPDIIYTSHFISRDDGETWEPTPCLIYNVCQANNDYVTGYKDGKVYMSTDCGVTWTTVDVPHGPWGMVYDIKDSTTVWMACESGNVMKVSNGEVTVFGEENGLGDERLYQVAQNPFNAAHLLACGTPVDNVVGYGLFESLDYGESWHIVPGTKLGSVDYYSVTFSPLERVALIGSYMGTFIYKYDVFHEYLEANGDKINIMNAMGDKKLEKEEDCAIGSLMGEKSDGNSKNLKIDFNNREFKKDFESAYLTLNAKLRAGGTLKVYCYDGDCENSNNYTLIAEKPVKYKLSRQKISVDITDYLKKVKDEKTNAHIMLEYTVKSDRYKEGTNLMNVLNAGGNGPYSPYIIIK